MCGVCRGGLVLATLAWLLVLHGLASAQVQSRPIGLFAVDVRYALARYGPTEEQAAAIGYEITDVPTRGWGVDVGAHVYPVRWRGVTFGIGGNVVTSSGHSQPVNAKGEPTGRESDIRFRGLASQVSVNFGNRDGWSYLSGGMGYSTFAISNEGYPEPATLPKRRTINFGGGARWGFRDHLAFTLDLRFYRMAAQEASVDRAADAGSTRFVFGAGLSFK